MEEYKIDYLSVNMIFKWKITSYGKQEGLRLLSLGSLNDILRWLDPNAKLHANL